MFTLGLLLTYGILGNALALLLFRALQRTTVDRASILFGSIGLAPGIVSIVLYLCFLLLPGASHFIYIGIVLAVFAIAPALSWRSFPQLAETYRSLFSRPCYLSGWSTIRVIVAIAILAIVLFASYKAILFPIQAHDALKHATTGRILYENCSLEYVPSNYPPGLHLLYVWSYLLQGGISSDYGVRTVAPIYLILTALLVWRWGEVLGKGAGLFAVLALVTVSVYTLEAMYNSIDAIRIFFFALGIFWVYWLTVQYSAPLLGIAVFTLVLALFTHAVGIVALPIAGILYCLFAKGRVIRRVGTGIALVLPAATIGLLAYPYQSIKIISNLQGRAIWLVTNAPDLSIVQHILTNYKFYGILPLLFLLSLLPLLWKGYQENRGFIFVAIGAVLTIGLIYGYLLCFDLYRYYMTAAPFAALCAGVLLSTLDGRAESS